MEGLMGRYSMRLLTRAFIGHFGVSIQNLLISSCYPRNPSLYSRNPSRYPRNPSCHPRILNCHPRISNCHPRVGGEPGEGKFKIGCRMLGVVKQWSPASANSSCVALPPASMQSFAGVTGKSV